MLGLICAVFLAAPFVLYVLFALRDRAVERRDQQIEDKCVRLGELFKEVCGPDRMLTRAYLQSHGGSAYPYDLFMIEYRGGAHIVDTIWLPVRQFLDTEDEEIRQIFVSELAQPGTYTIPDWIEALYRYVTHEKHAAR